MCVYMLVCRQGKSASKEKNSDTRGHSLTTGKGAQGPSTYE